MIYNARFDYLPHFLMDRCVRKHAWPSDDQTATALEIGCYGVENNRVRRGRVKCYKTSNE